MSSGSSDMAGSALGTAFSLLLLASITQGLQDVEVFYYEKMEAVVGQDVELPCTVKNSSKLQIVSIEWSKNRNENTKLALYNPRFGLNLFWPNVTIKADNSTGSTLSLSGVTKWDSGIYICDLTSFPQGSNRRETELKIKDDDVNIMCDMDSAVEVHAGENVSIQCRVLPNAQYRWTKNKKLVSETEYLELSWVTDAHAGVYTLTVNTGNRSLHREFIITVLPSTTRLRKDLVTVSPRSNVTEEGLIKSTDSGFTTSPTTGLSTTDTNGTWTTSMGTDGTDADPSNVSTAGEHVTSLTNYTHRSVSPSPATHTEPYHFNTSNPSHALNTSTSSDQSVVSNLATTLSYGSTVFSSTQEKRKESTLYPEVNSSTSPEKSSTLGSITESYDNSGATLTLRAGNVITTENKDTDGGRSHLLVLIIVPLLILIVVAGFLCRRKVIKQRMDLPPPFKPPPPPVKYTAARQSEVATQPFPTARCNSVTQLEDMKLKSIYV